jgi:hypothetical protein
MNKILFALITGVLLDGCAMSTPIERAEAICVRLGDPSPACKERQFNIERTREDAFNAEQRKYFQAELVTVTPAQPQKSQYERILDDGQARIKQDCAMNGGVYSQDNVGASCTR